MQRVVAVDAGLPARAVVPAPEPAADAVLGPALAKGPAYAQEEGEAVVAIGGGGFGAMPFRGVAAVDSVSWKVPIPEWGVAKMMFKDKMT